MLTTTSSESIWFEIARVEGVLFFGRQRLAHLANILPDIGKTLRQAIA
jgi:hypothetical protein